jgi:hypothetical protein
MRFNASRDMSSRILKITAGGVVAVIVFYIVTVGAVPAVARHMADGRLQWMRSLPHVYTLLEVYEWPADRAAVVPSMRWLFELSAEVWCDVVDAPETTA